MFLHELTTNPESDGTSAVESMEFIGILCSWALYPFEWTFGLDPSTFSTDCDLNKITLSGDLLHHIRSGSLQFSPDTTTLGRVSSFMKLNERFGLAEDERQRLEDFGVGPWDYFLYPSKKQPPPPIFHRAPDGTITPLCFDLSEPLPENLPRVKSWLHPFVALLFKSIYGSGSHLVDNRLVKPVIYPLLAVLNKWPSLEHNRFLPQITSPKKKPADVGYCPCYECGKWVYSHSSNSGYTSESPTSCDDLESWRNTVPIDIVSQGDPRIRGWALGVRGLKKDHTRDMSLRKYAMEKSDPAEETLRRAREQEQLRAKLAKPILIALASDESKRPTKRPRHTI